MKYDERSNVDLSLNSSKPKSLGGSLKSIEKAFLAFAMGAIVGTCILLLVLCGSH